MKRPLLVALAFVAVTLPATYLWLEWGRSAYSSQFGSLVVALDELLGVTGNPRGGQRIRFINVVPFTGLMLVTPGLSTRRRFGGLAIGLLVLFLSHLVINSLPGQDPQGRLQLSPVIAMASDALPFLLWVFIAAEPLRRFVRRGDSPKTATGPPDGNGDDE